MSPSWLQPDTIIVLDSTKQLIAQSAQKMQMRETTGTTRSWWEGGGGKAGVLAVRLCRWAAEDLQGDHSAESSHYLALPEKQRGRPYEL